jgi:intergrase/recombinase
MNITKELASQLLIESESFRNFVIQKMFSETSVVRSSVIDYISNNKNKKIACIKYIRDNFSVTEMNKAFSEWLFEATGGQFPSKVSIRSAKDFVENQLENLKFNC